MLPLRFSEKWLTLTGSFSSHVTALHQGSYKLAWQLLLDPSDRQADKQASLVDVTCQTISEEDETSNMH